MKGLNVIIAGVGGQGVILAGNILGLAATKQGFDVKKTDTLGMAQRGGSVVSHLRYSKKVFSPSIKKSDADVIIAFEKLEAARWIEYLKKGGLVFLNNLAIPPLAAHSGTGKYPDDAQIKEILKQKAGNIYTIDAQRYALKLGNIHLVNTILLGFALPHLLIKKAFLKEAITDILPRKVVAQNLGALENGLELSQS